MTEYMYSKMVLFFISMLLTYTRIYCFDDQQDPRYQQEIARQIAAASPEILNTHDIYNSINDVVEFTDEPDVAYYVAYAGITTGSSLYKWRCTLNKKTGCVTSTSELCTCFTSHTVVHLLYPEIYFSVVAQWYMDNKKR